MNDLPTFEQRWSIVSLWLEKFGMDLSKLNQLQQGSIIRGLESDEVVGEDEDVWQDWVNEYLEAHPAHALPRWKRYRNAKALIENWHAGWGDPDSDPEPEDLAEHKYALLTWHRGDSLVRSAGDTIEDVLEAIIMIQYSEEDPEHVESFIDLDTGEPTRLYGDPAKPKLQTSITLTYDGHTHTHHFS